MIDYLTHNKDWLTLVVSIVVGVATVIATCVNAYLVSKQNEIYQEQTALQKKQNQPVFSFSTQLEQDLDDGKYGTEVLTIRNVGQTTSQPCQVKVNVYFKITKSVGADRDSLYFQIEDYFNVASNGDTGDNEVYYAKGCGSNRKYAELYYAAIEESKKEESNCYFFIDKFTITKIEYCDIYNKEHIRYYMDKAEISKELYNNIVSQAYDDYRFNSLRNISFSGIKTIIDDVHK
jgi:hypothetical protein